MSGAGCDDLVFFESSFVKVNDWGGGGFDAACDQKGGLCHAVARIEGLRTEARWGEGGGKFCQSFGADGFSSGKCDFPMAEVESLALLGSGLATEKVVGEVGCAAGGGLVVGHGLEPADRLLDEGERRHQDAGDAQVQGLENVADKSHVVEEGEPADADGGWSATESNF